MTEMGNYYLEILETLREPRPNRSQLGFDGAALQNTFLHFARLQEDGWPDHVTYYCTAEIGASVVGLGHAWMCDVRNMNDESELLFAAQLFDAEVEAFRAEAAFPSGLLDAMAESKSEFVATSDGEAFNDKFIVAMCTSALEDDAAMWDRYGDSGQGVAIHFNLRKLVTAVSTASIFVPNSNRFDTGVVEVCYPDGGCDCLKLIATEALAAYDQVQSLDERDIIRNLLHATVLRYLVRHKHPSFASEREFRLYSRAPATKTWSGSDHIYEDPIRHTKIILPHLAINESQEDFWRALIPRVTLGPAWPDKLEGEMNTALAKRGLEGTTRTSSCPLRQK